MKVFSSAPYDRVVKGITLFLWILLSGIDGTILFMIFSSMRAPPAIVFMTGVLVISVTIIVLGITYLF